MVERSFLPKISYDSPDFYAIIESLKAYVKSGYSEYWNDFFESNEGMVIIDLLAYIGDQLHFYLDRRVNGIFPDTVDRRDAILRQCLLQGYSAAGPIGATLQACSRYSPPSEYDFSEYPGDVFAVGDSFYIKGSHWDGQVFVAGPTINVDGVIFEAVDDITIQYTDQHQVTQLPEAVNDIKIITLTLKEGVSRYDRFVSLDSKFQIFKSSLEGIIDGSWQICVDGVKPTDFDSGGTASHDGWIQARENSFVNHVPGSHVYTIDYFGNNKIRVIFGDGETFGAVPHGDISIAYRVGGGTSTNIAAGVLDPDEHKLTAIFNDISEATSDPVSIKLVNLSFQLQYSDVLYGGGAVYGADGESLDLIRIKGPQHVKHTGRAITKDDTVSVALEFSYNDERIAKASVVNPATALSWGKTIVVGGPPYVDLRASYTAGYYPLKYDGQQISIYIPSAAINLVKVYIWGLGTEGQPVAASTPLVVALSNRLNLGNQFGGEYLGDVGMMSVNYLIYKGMFKDVVINLNAMLVPAVGLIPAIYGIWYDPAYDKNAIEQQIRAAVVALFNGYDPGKYFQVMDVWRVLSEIKGVLRYGVKVADRASIPDPNNPPTDPTNAVYQSEDLQVATTQIARMFNSPIDIIFTLVAKA